MKLMTPSSTRLQTDEDNEDVTQRDVVNYDVKHLSLNVPVRNVVEFMPVICLFTCAGAV